MSITVSPPPTVKDAPSFDLWLYRFWSRVTRPGQVLITDLGVTGTANQLIKVNAGATAYENATLGSADGSVTITMGAGTIDLSAATGAVANSITNTNLSVASGFSYLVIGDMAVLGTSDLSVTGSFGVF